MTHNGPLSPIEIELVALNLCAPSSALAGPTALVHDGFKGFEQPETYVVLPEGAQRPEVPGLVPHWSTRLGESDIHPLGEPRRTRPPRSIIDFASWCGNDRYARAIVVAAFQQGLVDNRSMREALTRRGPCRRRALIVESILDAVGGIQSLPERDFNDLRRRAGLPPATRQSRIQTPNGRYFLDVEWKQHGIAVEIHGIPHIHIRQWDADILRGNEVVIAGKKLLAFTSYAIRHEQAVVIDQLQRAFATRIRHAS
ncbi:MAG: hypothetical protein ABIR57_12130 [Aeromicrobium sp.]